MKNASFILLAASVITFTGCSKPAAPASTANAAANPNNRPATVLGAEAPDAAAPPAPPGGLPAASAPTASAPNPNGTVPAANGDDVAFYRSRNAEGQLATDLDVLNNALMAYGTDGKQRPPFKGLPDLVTQGLIKKMPTPPDGKKFVFDPKTAKAMLVDNK